MSALHTLSPSDRFLEAFQEPIEIDATSRVVYAQQQRARLIDRLHSDRHHDLAEVLEKCALPLVLVCQCCGETRTVETGCRKRWCPVCVRRLAAERVARYQGAVRRMQWPLFLTLTVKNSADALGGLAHLRSGWKKFRRTKWWNATEVAGGISAVEITHKGNGWHPHLHAIIDCKWLAVRSPAPQRGCTRDEYKARCTAAKHELNERWSESIGYEGKATYVSRANLDSVREALKYSVKPSDLIDLDGDPAELIHAMKGARLTIAFGNCHGLVGELRRIEKEQRGPMQCDTCEAPGNWYPLELAVRNPSPQQLEARRKALARKLAADNAQRTAAARRTAAAEPRRQELRKYHAALAKREH